MGTELNAFVAQRLRQASEREKEFQRNKARLWQDIRSRTTAKNAVHYKQKYATRDRNGNEVAWAEERFNVALLYRS